MHLEVVWQRNAFASTLARQLIAKVPPAMSNEDRFALLEGIDEPALAQPRVEAIEHIRERKGALYVGLSDPCQGGAELAQLASSADGTLDRLDELAEEAHLRADDRVVVEVLGGEPHGRLRARCIGCVSTGLVARPALACTLSGRAGGAYKLDDLVDVDLLQSGEIVVR